MKEKVRPTYHFTPPKNWMNDPNGLVYVNGEYHLFYQHNPFGKEWGHMSWGHAVSDNLVHWQHLPVAILEELENCFTIFSGSAVVDENNCSGFGKDGRPTIVAFYTADYPQKKLQNIHIAYSVDLGRTFSKYHGNPILDVNNSKFGDPKVFWHPDTAKWIMVNILGEKQGRIALYNSSDLKTWDFMSEFDADEKVPGKWECPDLFPLVVDDDLDNIKWILKVNSTSGPVSKYFIGIFDGHTFCTDADFPEAYDLNFGDIYAESTWNNIPVSDGRRIQIGWVPQSPFKNRPWTGMQSIPRTLKLESIEGSLRICQEPIAEIKGLRKNHNRIENRILKGNTKLELTSPGMELEIIANFKLLSSIEFGFQINFNRGNEIVIGYSKTLNQIFIYQTGKKRLNAFLADRVGKIQFHVFTDHSIIEVFVNKGEIVFTVQIDQNLIFEKFYLHNKEGDIEINSIDMWELN
jgi:fructan beta-fructosidase